MSNISLGLVGCGAAARTYYLQALKEHPEICENLYLVDKDIKQAQILADQFGISQITHNYREIIGKVQGVIIAVPPFLHHSIAMEFLKNETHVLCEKPLAESFLEAKEMVQEAKKNNVTLSVNNTRRIYPSFSVIKRLISNGDIGTLLSIKYFEAGKFEWESATGFYVDPNVSTKGVVLDLGAHVLDLVCWWINGKPKLISYQDDSFGGPESVACLKAEKESCEIEVRLNRLNDLDSSFIITGELGSIEGSVSDLNTVILKSRSGKETKIKLKSKVKALPDFVKPIVNNFINMMTQNKKPLVPGEDVIHSIKLIEECYNGRSRYKMVWYENLHELVNE